MVQHRTHPKRDEIIDKSNGPAKVVYPDGSYDLTRDLAYTTAIYYTTLDGDHITTKGAAIKKIVHLTLEEVEQLQP